MRIVGERGVTFLDGLGQAETGIAVYRAPRVVLDGLSVTGFRQAGLSFDHTAPVEISSTRVFANRRAGIEIRDTEVIVQESVLDENGGHGISCEMGHLEFRAEEGGKGVAISRNGGNGVRAIGCHVLFEGPSLVTLNQSGLVAEHGAEINLMGRTDVVVTGNTLPAGGGAPTPGDPRGVPKPLSHLALCELVADNHGLVCGYRNAPMTDACACLDSHFGVCDPD